MSGNPFTLEKLPPEAPFCNRQAELAAFEQYARDNLKVVLFSPRRFGKTSLLARVQDNLAGKGHVCAYADFSTIATVRGAAEEIMRGLFAALHKKESLLEKGARFLRSLTTFKPHIRVTETGWELTAAPDSNLDEMTLFRRTVEELAEFVRGHDAKFTFVLDEFQEITRLRESAELEGILRSHIQGLPAGFFFLGSRRSVLLAMFNAGKRPFFKLARNEELGPLPEEDMVSYLVSGFEGAGKTAAEDVCRRIARESRGHAYYMQFLAQEAFYVSGDEVAPEDVDRAVQGVLSKEQHGFAGMIQGLQLQQLRLLKALAAGPAHRMTGADFIARSGMAASTIKDAHERLVEQDLIEQDAAGAWRVVDPFLARWLQGGLQK